MIAEKEEYRAAIALSNTALSLQLNGCYQQAYATFQDAIGLIHMAVRPTCSQSSQGVEDCGCTSSCIQSKLRSGTVRLANQYRYVDEESPGIRDQPKIISLPDDSGASTTLREVIGHGDDLSNWPLIFIRFEDYGIETSEERDRDIDSSILLHNFALSGLSLCTNLPPKSIERECVLQNTLRLLQLCVNVLAVRVAKASGSSNLASLSGSDPAFSQIFTITTIVTRSMVQALSLSGRHQDDQSQCLRNLTQMTQVLREMSAFDIQSVEMPAPAA